MKIVDTVIELMSQRIIYELNLTADEKEKYRPILKRTILIELVDEVGGAVLDKLVLQTHEKQALKDTCCRDYLETFPRVECPRCDELFRELTALGWCKRCTKDKISDLDGKTLYWERGIKEKEDE